MKDQFVEMWRINNRANLILLDAITPEGFACTLSKQGGRSVALQFAHLHNARLGWLGHISKELYQEQTKIGKDDQVDRALLKERLSESADAVATVIEKAVENGGKVKGFKRGIGPFIGYLISHDAHHRGSILLTLKQCGHKVPSKAQQEIWEWNRI